MSVLCEAFTFFYKMIFHESGDFRISHYQLAQPKAPHHIIGGEHLRQTVEALDGLLLALHVGSGVTQLVVEIGLSQSAPPVSSPSRQW